MKFIASGPTIFDPERAWRRRRGKRCGRLFRESGRSRLFNCSSTVVRMWSPLPRARIIGLQRTFAGSGRLSCPFLACSMLEPKRRRKVLISARTGAQIQQINSE